MATGARIIWIFFGDMKGGELVVQRLTAMYSKLQGEAAKKGLTLGFPSTSVNKDVFLRHISEPATVAFVWHSHGIARPFLSGDMLAGGGGVIKASEVSRTQVSDNLQFAALLGCGGFPTSTMKQEWLRAFRLDRFPDAERRLFAYGGIIGSNEMFDFSAPGGAGSFGPYKFRDWLDKIQT